MKQFEYLITHAIDPVENYLNRYGSQGWALVQVLNLGAAGLQFFWKREKAKPIINLDI